MGVEREGGEVERGRSTVGRVLAKQNRGKKHEVVICRDVW